MIPVWPTWIPLTILPAEPAVAGIDRPVADPAEHTRIRQGRCNHRALPGSPI